MLGGVKAGDAYRLAVAKVKRHAIHVLATFHAMEDVGI
jgi:hypothetical protein